MKDFSVLNGQGQVVRTGVCQDEFFAGQAAAPDETVVPGHRAFPEMTMIPSWSAQRRAAYPSMADFADALYWADQGDNAQLTAYFAACKAVKLQFPKPAA